MKDTINQGSKLIFHKYFNFKKKNIVYHSSPRRRFQIVRLLGILMCTWPVIRVKGFTKFAYEIGWWFFVANHVSLFIPIIRAFRHNLNDILMATYSWIEMMIVIECLISLVYTKLMSSSFKVLLLEAEHRVSIKQNKAYIKEYTNLYTILYILITVCYVMITFMFFQHPATSNQQLFLTALYSFELNSRLITILLYWNQIFLLLHSSCIPHLDMVIVILIYMCTDRLKQLEIDFRTASKYEELIVCIREHQRILSLIDDVNSVARFVVIKTVMSYILMTLAAGLQILHDSMTVQWVHQSFIISFVFLRIFIYADCTEHMTSANEGINSVIYYSNWFEEDRRTIRAKVQIIQRCQKFPKIYIGGIMPALNKNYFITLIYITASYLMTLYSVTSHS